MVREKLPAIGRIAALTLIVVTLGLVVTAFIRARRQARPPGLLRTKAVLKANVTSIIEGYKYVRTEKGRESVRLLAARDIAYEDGRHDLEKVDLTAFGEAPGKTLQIISDRGTWLRDPGIVTFEGNVRVTSSDGLLVTTESLRYDQLNEVALTDVAIQFSQGEISGSSIGAQLYSKTRNLTLLKDVRLISTNQLAENESGLPVEIQSESGEYAELDGVVRFSGNARVVQGSKSASADTITAVISLETRKLERIEVRGNSSLRTTEQGRDSELTARDMDFHFDAEQHLKSAIASGTARARSLEKDSPREIAAERLEAVYAPVERDTRLRSIVSQGRTTMKIEGAEGSPGEGRISDRVIESDNVQATFREDGKNLLKVEARGNAVLTVTPRKLAADSYRKRMRASTFTAEFLETGNLLSRAVADGNVAAEFDPLVKDGEQNRRTLTGRRLTAAFNPETQDISRLTIEGNVKMTDGDRKATAQRATYYASTQTVALREKPQLWDTTARANADEIDANLDTGESYMRGQVRTTYYSRESTGDSTPFKDKKSPVSVASDRATVKHHEGAALFTGNVRAWQDDDFVRAETLELDNGEKSMMAIGNVQSAFYDFEREDESGRKETVPVFASADRINYNGDSKTVHYLGAVRLKQGTDLIEAAKADAVMDEEYQLVELKASGTVVMQQPNRRAIGDQVVYTVASDKVELTGNLAMVEDLESKSITKSAKLTLHFRDARIEANDEGGTNKRVKTTHRIQN